MVSNREGTMSDADRVEAAGLPLRCHHCSGERFHERAVTLDRTFLGGLMNFEGLFGHHAAVYVCARCGFAHFFFPTGDEIPAATQSRDTNQEAIRCLSCSEEIPAGNAACPCCGWTWMTTP